MCVSGIKKKEEENPVLLEHKRLDGEMQKTGWSNEEPEVLQAH